MVPFALPVCYLGIPLALMPENRTGLRKVLFMIGLVPLEFFRIMRASKKVPRLPWCQSRTVLALLKIIYWMHNKMLDQTMSANRTKLVPIVKTVPLCGRHNIPLRGHRDDSSHYGSVNCGTFQALLDFRVDSGYEL